MDSDRNGFNCKFGHRALGMGMARLRWKSFASWMIRPSGRCPRSSAPLQITCEIDWVIERIRESNQLIESTSENVQTESTRHGNHEEIFFLSLRKIVSIQRNWKFVETIFIRRFSMGICINHIPFQLELISFNDFVVCCVCADSVGISWQINAEKFQRQLNHRSKAMCFWIVAKRILLVCVCVAWAVRLWGGAIGFSTMGFPEYGSMAACVCVVERCSFVSRGDIWKWRIFVSQCGTLWDMYDWCGMEVEWSTWIPDYVMCVWSALTGFNYSFMDYEGLVRDTDGTSRLLNAK